MPDIYTDTEAVSQASNSTSSAAGDAAGVLNGQTSTATDPRFAQISNDTRESSRKKVDKTDEESQKAREASEGITETDEDSSKGFKAAEDSGAVASGTPAPRASGKSKGSSEGRPSLPTASRGGSEAASKAAADMLQEQKAQQAQQIQQQQIQQQQIQQQQIQQQEQYRQQMEQQQAQRQQMINQQIQAQQQQIAQQQAQQQAQGAPAPQGIEVPTDDGGITLTRDQLEQIMEQVNAGGGEASDVAGGDASLDGAERSESSGDVPFTLGEPTDAGLLDPSEVTYERDPEDATLSSEELSSFVDAAMDANGITDPAAREKWGTLMEYLVEHEAGNQVNAGNGWDSNAVGETMEDGLPAKSSRGVAQCIPTTFAANHVEGTSTSIYDPTASVAASINYIMDRYGCDTAGNGVDEFYNDRYPTYQGY